MWTTSERNRNLNFWTFSSFFPCFSCFYAVFILLVHTHIMCRCKSNDEFWPYIMMEHVVNRNIINNLNDDEAENSHENETFVRSWITFNFSLQATTAYVAFSASLKIRKSRKIIHECLCIIYETFWKILSMGKFLNFHGASHSFVVFCRTWDNFLNIEISKPRSEFLIFHRRSWILRLKKTLPRSN